MSQPNRRSIMTLYTNKMCPYCHRVRIVLAEKGIAAEFIEVDQKNVPEELLSINPYGSVPTLVDRDLILYESHIILEYLEERFPHPPLMPIYPVARARSRLMVNRVDRDWYSMMNTILANHPGADKARQDLRDSLVSIAPVFGDSPYFLSEEFTLVDCALAALLWRLPQMGVELEPTNVAAPIKNYMKQIFSRPSFHQSLTDAEKEFGDLPPMQVSTTRTVEIDAD